MNCNHVIWDFNGTVLDDVEVGITSLNTLLSRRGLPNLCGVEAYYAVFGFPVIDYYRRVGFDFEKERFEDVAVEWVAEYEKNFKNARLRFNLLRAVAGVKEFGISQIILSATENDMLQRQVDALGIRKHFDSVLGMDNIYAKSKLALASNWAKSVDGGILMVGDTVHDFDVAQAISADCVLITGGHQSRAALEKCGCPIITDPLEVVEYIKKRR